MPFSFKPPEGQPQPSAFSAEAIGTRIKETKGGIFSFISYMVFGVAVTVTVVLYGYNLQLASQVNGLKEQLDGYNASLAGMPLVEMEKLSNRIRFVGQLVNGHASVNTAFRILEETVENQVLYSRFDLRSDPATNRYEVSIAALAPDYRSVAQQLDTLKVKPYTKYIQSTNLVNVNPDDKGKINFSMKLILAIRGSLPEEVTFGSETTEPIPSASTIQQQVQVSSTTTP